MMNRRKVITGAVIAGAFLSSPATACRAPAPKDWKGYTKAIDSLFAAWWARDYERFLESFRHPERHEPLPDRALFDAHYSQSAHRFRGDLLFNGASVIAQVITPQGPDYERGICGGYAKADLFLVKFYPGVKAPIVESVQFLDMDLLASTEWKEPDGQQVVTL